MMSNSYADIGRRVFLAIADRRIARAECTGDTGWQVETVLDGPSPVVLAADPHRSDVVYAGTQGNGVYRSADSGRSWMPCGLAGRIVKSIVVSSHDPDVIYAGVKPAAVFKTTDGGRQWAELAGFRRIPNRWWWFSPAEPPFRAYVNAIALFSGGDVSQLFGLQRQGNTGD